MTTTLKHDRSRRLFSRAQDSLAGGVSSGFRRNQKPVPLYFTEGRGARLSDVDGNSYVDYTLGWGPQILGHSHPAVVDAVRAQVAKAQTFGAQCELEILVAEEICRLVPACERVTFSTTGSEAVQVALRIARAFTGRQKVVKFEGHYHGWIDTALWNYRSAPLASGHDAWKDEVSPAPGTAGQLAAAADGVLVLPWNDLARVARLFDRHGDDIACVITEPVMANTAMIPPAPGYLEGLRRLCIERGILLIFDEVITGFRVALGGARESTGVIPDLSVYGKAVAGGFPMSAVGGRADLLDLVATQKVLHAGTLNGNPVSLAAALATLRELGRDGGAALRRARTFGETLQREIRGVCARHGQPVQTQGVGSVFWILFTESPVDSYTAFVGHEGARFRAFAERVVDQGVLVMDSGRLYVSTVHTDEEMDMTVRAFDHALA